MHILRKYMLILSEVTKQNKKKKKKKERGGHTATLMETKGWPRSHPLWREGGRVATFDLLGCLCSHLSFFFCKQQAGNPEKKNKLIFSQNIPVRSKKSSKKCVVFVFGKEFCLFFFFFFKLFCLVNILWKLCFVFEKRKDFSKTLANIAAFLESKTYIIFIMP